MRPDRRLHAPDDVTKPLLLLDVDGVIFPFGGGPPPGYERTEIRGYEVTWRPSLRGSVERLTNLFDVVWATTWEHHANEAVSPLLGLGELPVIEFTSGRAGDTWKLSEVVSYVGDRATAWVDDELYPDAHTWAEGRQVPTLLIRPSSSVGITDEHVGDLEAFARSAQEA